MAVVSSSSLDIGNFRAYLGSIARYRHFWTHLAFSDIRARFRRSYLGILWVILQPLLLTVLMSVVLKYVFHQEFVKFSVYVFSGVVMWEFFTTSITVGSNSFIAAEGYIRQMKLPMLIFPLKSMLYCSIIFALSFIGFFTYTAILMPETISWMWLWTFPAFLALFIFCMPLAVMSAITNLKYRDFQQAIGLLLQVLWYVSPVFIARDVFNNPGLAEVSEYNPVTMLLDIFRAPLLSQELPSLANYQTLAIYSVVLWLLAYRMLKRTERRLVFFF
jgi:lipopolysaccharide transport system permease protein